MTNTITTNDETLIALKNPTPSRTPAGGSPLLDQQPTALAPEPSAIDETRRNLVARALEFAAHGHGEITAELMSDAVDCLTGVLRDCENRLFTNIDQWREAVERALGVDPDPVNHTPEWAYERVLAKREIGNGVRDESGRCFGD